MKQMVSLHRELNPYLPRKGEMYNDALLESSRRARSFFGMAYEERITKALTIIDESRILLLGGSHDAIVESDKRNGKRYVVVRGMCECEDSIYRTIWCKHTLARAILIRTLEMLNSNYTEKLE